MERVFVPDPTMNVRRRRWTTLGLAALALALALPAGTPAKAAAEQAVPVSLSVAASLSSCEVSDFQVRCEFTVSYEPIPGASSYTARVTSPDGSVADLGSVSATGTTFALPYVGDGTYSFRVSAYG